MNYNETNEEIDDELIFVSKIQRIVEKDEDYKEYMEHFKNMGFINRIIQSCYETIKKEKPLKLLIEEGIIVDKEGLELMDLLSITNIKRVIKYAKEKKIKVLTSKKINEALK